MTTRTDQFRAIYLEHRLVDQQEYYRQRVDEYERAHRQALGVRNVLFVLSAMAAGASQITDDRARGEFGALAAVLAALAGAVTAYESLIGYPSLLKIFHDAWVSLQAARIDWDLPDDDVEHSIRRVEQVFRSENGQWGQLAVPEPGATGDRPIQQYRGAPDR